MRELRGKGWSASALKGQGPCGTIPPASPLCAAVRPLRPAGRASRHDPPRLSAVGCPKPLQCPGSPNNRHADHRAQDRCRLSAVLHRQSWRPSGSHPEALSARSGHDFRHSPAITPCGKIAKCGINHGAEGWLSGRKRRP